MVPGFDLASFNFVLDRPNAVRSVLVIQLSRPRPVIVCAAAAAGGGTVCAELPAAKELSAGPQRDKRERARARASRENIVHNHSLMCRCEVKDLRDKKKCDMAPENGRASKTQPDV